MWSYDGGELWLEEDKIGIPAQVGELQPEYSSGLSQENQLEKRRKEKEVEPEFQDGSQEDLHVQEIFSFERDLLEIPPDVGLQSVRQQERLDADGLSLRR